MLALAGHPLGLSFVVLDPAADTPAAAVADHIRAPFDSPTALDRLAGAVDRVTYEFENVPVAAARHLCERVTVRPPAGALEAAQDRLAEKRLFASLGIPTAPFVAVSDEAELREALSRLGKPAVLKTRRLGYDGRGQTRLGTTDDMSAAWGRVGGAPSILEEAIPFERELSVIAAAAPDGTRAFYPLVENRHEAGILRVSLAPAPELDPSLQELAEDYADRLLAALDYVGVLAIELFQVGGTLWANEVAPRVHNSGHWTIEGAVTSQFENHLRAVADLPLGDPSPRGLSAIVNLIGTTPPVADAVENAGLHLHIYGKAPRPGRKLGHMTWVAASEPERAGAVERMMQLAGEHVSTLPR
jgi:5-(carboxyamino)imidazole ribonucleotide synthase